MSHQTADRLRVVAAWIDTLPVPEPNIHSYPGLYPEVRWHVTDVEALQVLAAIGGEWGVTTAPEGQDPLTTAFRFVDHMGTRIDVTVAVVGVNLPDLASGSAR